MTIFYSITIISNIYAFGLLVLKLQAEFNALHKSLIDKTCVAMLANFCFSALGSISLYILQSYFNVIK